MSAMHDRIESMIDVVIERNDDTVLHSLDEGWSCDPCGVKGLRQVRSLAV